MRLQAQPVEQPDLKPTRKVAAVGAAGAASTLLVFLLGEFGVIVGLLALVAGYFKRESAPPAERGLALIEVAVVLLVIGFLWLALGAPGT